MKLGIGTLMERYRGSPKGALQYFPETAADVTGTLGLTAANLFLFQEASTSVIDVIAAQNLVDQGTPIYAQATPFPRLAVGVDASVDEGLKGPVWPAFSDDGTTSHAWLFLMYAGASAANIRSIHHFAGAANFRSEIAVNGVISAVATDAVPVTVTATITGKNHSSSWFPLLWVMDRSAATMRIRTHLGSASVALGTLGACSATPGRLYFGSGQAGTMTPLSFTWACRMTGTNAQGLVDAQIIDDLWRGP